MLTHTKLIFVLIALIFIFLPNVLLGATAEDNFFNPQATFKETTERNKVKEGPLRKGLELSKNINGRSKIGKLGLTRESESRAIAHIREDFRPRDITIAQLLLALTLAFVIFLLAHNKMSFEWKVLLVIGVILELLLASGRT